jgi:MFS family permease
MGVVGAGVLPAGYLADSYRRYSALILASAIATFGVAYLVISSANSYPLVLLGVGLIGWGIALWHPCAMGGLSVQFPTRRGMALSVHGVGASIGDALSPIIVGAIIGIISWQVTLQFHLIPALLIAFFLWRGLGPTTFGDGAKPSFRSYLTGLRTMVANRQVLTVMSANALTNMARLSILTFLPIYLQEDLGYSPFILGVYLTLLYVMGIVSQPVMGVLSDRIGRKAVMLPSFALMGLLYIALVYAPRGLLLGLVIATLGLFFYAILNITQTAVMDVSEERVQASTMGVMGLFSQPFTLSAPIIAGFLVENYEIKAAFWFAAATALLATAVLVPVRFRSVRSSGGG